MPKGVFKKSEEHIAKLRAHLVEHNKRLGIIKRGKKRPEISGDKHRDWKGGRVITKMGYVLIYKPEHPNCNKNGYVFEHRLVMEAHLGRYLTKKEVIHHINGNKQDNRIENLQLMTNAGHTSLEQSEDYSDRVCSICESHTTYTEKNGTVRWCYLNGKSVCKSCWQKDYDRRRKIKKLNVDRY